MNKVKNELPLVTIITIVFNNKDYILEAIKSVRTQKYNNIEYIVIDGASTDGTVEIINKNRSFIDKYITEPDNGIYDALNKGITLASGEIIGILHSDDFFINENVVSDSVNSMIQKKSDICFSNMIIVERDNVDNIIRFYKSTMFRICMLRIGWMPAHPTMFIRRSLYSKVGLYSCDYKIAGDFDFLVRAFYKHNAIYSSINRVTVAMRVGGVSNSGFASKAMINKEVYRSLKRNGIFTFYPFIYLRYFIRIFEFITKPSKLN